MIKIDVFDLKILSYLYDARNKEIDGFREITKAIMKEEKNSRKDLDKIDKKIRYRFTKFIENGIIEEQTDDDGTIYRLSKKVWKALIINDGERQMIIELP